MIQYQLKLKLTRKQEGILLQRLWHLTGVYNFAIRKIELDAVDGFYHSKKDFQNLLANHGDKPGIPSHTIQGILLLAYNSWRRCFKKLGKKPRFKGQRNKLNGIPFPDPIREPRGCCIKIPILGSVRYHKQEPPKGGIKCGRIIRRASGWYLCLFIDAQPKAIPIVANGRIGIDPGFKSLLTLSTGEKIGHPRELEISAQRLAQSQRGGRKKLTARMHERIANQRKDRNHKLSRRLVSENRFIAFSADNHKAIAKQFGKSVASSSHGQLRQMLAYKSSSCGRKYVEVDSKHTTMRCSVCGEINQQLRGLNKLAVREWDCACGAHLDRDINAAKNVLRLGLGLSHEAANATA